MISDYVNPESAVLGCMILAPECIVEVAARLQPSFFRSPDHADLFRTLVDMKRTGEPIDQVTVYAHVGDSGLIIDVCECVACKPNAVYYARHIREIALRQRLLDVSEEVRRKGEMPEVGLETLQELMEKQLKEIKDARFSEIGEVSADWAGDACRRALDREALGQKPVFSGFDDIDSITGGFVPGQLIYLAARPSHGKSTLAANMATYVCETGGRVLFVSLEMTREQIEDHIIVHLSGVPLARQKNPSMMTEGDEAALTRAGANLSEWAQRLIIESPPRPTIEGVEAIIERHNAVEPLTLAIIDYLHLVRGGSGEKEHLRLADLSGRLKGLAIGLELPLLVLSQLNRGPETRTDHRPFCADLRGSGALEQDADIILLLYRPELYEVPGEEGRAYVEIAKNRNGAVGRATLDFEGRLFTFKSPKRQWRSVTRVKCESKGGE